MTTDQIEIYVRSSPLGRIGIHWRKVSSSDQASQRTEIPEILMEPTVPDPDDDSKLSVNSVINTVKPCLILAKYNGKVFLEVTGIDATPDRSEKLGRRISEVVLWVGDDNTEKKLRQLAYFALLGLWNPESKFRTAISSSIEFDGLNDYKVKADVLNDMYECPEKYFELEGDNSSSHNYLEPNEIKTFQDVIQLATQLRDKSFDGIETAVIISEIKQTESERWLNHRGNVAKQPEVTPIILEREPVTLLQGGLGSKKPQRETSKPKIRSRLIVIGVVLIFLLLTFLTLGKKYLSNGEQSDQPIPILEVLPMQ